MTINQLIQRLSESGDEKWRETAQIRILDSRGNILSDELDLFDVKDGANTVDIHIPY